MSSKISKAISSSQSPVDAGAVLTSHGGGVSAPSAAVGSPTPKAVQAGAANEIKVTGFADTLAAGDGVVSLREAVLQPISGLREKTIILAAGTYTLGLDGAESPQTRDLDIQSNMAIVGQGQGITIIDGMGLDRIFEIFPGASLTLSNLTLANGHVANQGGGIYNGGIVQLTHVELDNNTATMGGALYNAPKAVAVVSDCVFSNNKVSGVEGTAGGNGGAGRIHQEDAGSYIEEIGDDKQVRWWYTFSGNPGAVGGVGTPGGNVSGGAVFNAAGASLSIVRDEFSGNGAEGGKGGAGGEGGRGGTHYYTTNGTLPPDPARDMHDGDGGNGGGGGKGGDAYGGAISNEGNLNVINPGENRYDGNMAVAGEGGSGGQGGLSGGGYGVCINGSDGLQGGLGKASSPDVYAARPAVANASSAGNDSLKGTAGADFLGGAAGNDQIHGLSGNDTLQGDDGNDTLQGGEGDDSLTGGAGNDSLSGGTGTDCLVEAANVNLVLTNSKLTGNGTDTLASVEQARLAGGAGDNTLNAAAFTLGPVVLDGGAGKDRLSGGGGGDTLLGGPGDDTLNGGAGDDKLAGEAGNDSIVGGAGTDLLVEAANVNFTLANNALTGNGKDTLSGIERVRLASGDGNNTLDAAAFTLGAVTLEGGPGNDTLVGGSRDDTLSGGTGNDTYVVGSGADKVLENVGEGTDTVRSFASYTLPANVEHLSLAGTAAVNATGNGLANKLTGNPAANTLDGKAGADTLQGGAGDDSYIVDVPGDKIVEAVNAGQDGVLSTVDYVLPDNVENLSLAGKAAAATGNGLANTLAGNGLPNILDGKGGVDVLRGGGGGDTYVVDSTADKVVETAGGGVDLVRSQAGYTLPAYVENLVLTGTAALNGTGNELDNSLAGNGAGNTLAGGLGNDRLDGGAGSDVLQGGAGNDTYVVDSGADKVAENVNQGVDKVESKVSYTLPANVENLTLTGATALSATGNELANVLAGNALGNLLDGQAGVDSLQGGAGDDTYVVDRPGDKIVENPGAGNDSVQSSADYVLPESVENLTLAGAALNGTGNAQANILEGNALANTLDGGAGADTLRGGAGDDTYLIDNPGDAVAEEFGAGNDWLLSAVDYALPANVENLALTGAAVAASGNGLANSLIGDAAGNFLDGGEGVDAMKGGEGGDTYVVDNSADSVQENPGEGEDTVRSSASYVLPANVENLVLTGALAIDGVGNELANAITGNAAANTLDGGAGDDQLNGGAGTDTLRGGAGNDSYWVDNSGDKLVEEAGAGVDWAESQVTYTLPANVENLALAGSSAIDATGNALGNTLAGNAAANTLDGKEGADTLQGGAGGDLYRVDHVDDNVVEYAYEGTDTVQSSISYALAPYVENLTLTGAVPLDGIGNELDNILAGNAAVNTLTGGAGDDTYIVDNADDRAVENPGEGADTVLSSVTYMLPANVENLTLTGGAAVNATGNELDNALTGNAGINVLSGGAGDDTYVMDNTADKIVENEAGGMDTVQSSVTYALTAANVENLVLTGSLAVNATGNALDNALAGNAAANRLDGGEGADSLRGGDGADTFVIGGIAGGADRVLDFQSGGDRLLIKSGADGFNIGNGDQAINYGAEKSYSPAILFGYEELAIFTNNLSGPITAAKAAASIYSVWYSSYGDEVFVFDNGADTAVFKYHSQDGNSTVDAGELTLLATLQGTPQTTLSDYLFG